MDDQFSLNNQTNSQFGLWRKWFWIGIIMALANIFLGLIYGVALAIEKDRRKEGFIIIAVSVIWTVVLAAFIFPWLVSSGILPHYKVLQIR